MADFLGQWSSKWVPRPAALALPGNMLGMQFLGSYHNGIGNSGEGTERSVLKCPAHDSASHYSLRITALSINLGVVLLAHGVRTSLVYYIVQMLFQKWLKQFKGSQL